MGECVRGRVGNHTLQICKSEALKALGPLAPPPRTMPPRDRRGRSGSGSFRGAMCQLLALPVSATFTAVNQKQG